MSFLTTLVPKLAVMLLTWFFKRKADTEQSKKDLIAFNEIMHRQGLTSVKLRLNSVNQIDRVKEMWSEENAKNK